MRAIPWLLIIVALAGVVATAKESRSQAAPPQLERLTIASETFTLEVAADDRTREKGLMGRTQIAPDRGMLFIYPSARVLSFWMANCLIDIDILYVDAQGKIVSTHKMKAPLPRRDDESQAAYEARLARYSSKWPAQFAIEL